MSAKQSVDDTSPKVNEVAEQLEGTDINKKDIDDANANKSNKKKNKKKKAKNPDEVCNTENEKQLETEQTNDKSDQKQEGENDDEAGASEEAKKKRKRNRNKNKKKVEDSENKNSTGGAIKQTDPPTLPVCELFPDGTFPIGQIMDHHIAQDDKKAADRFSSEEARAIDRAQLDMYNEIRQAAEAHRQTRQHIQKWVKPGMKMIDICNELESTARKLINENGLKVP